jgi:hypothetical protein
MLRVAFVGIKFENLPQDIQHTISWRMAQLLETQDAFLLSKPEDLQIQNGQTRIAELVGNQDAASFFEFARQFQFDYIFSGALANRSSDAYGILLVGNLHRYDLATGQVNSYSLNVEYDQLGNELLKFKQAYIDLLPNAKAGQKIWSKLFIGGIIVGAAVLVRYLAGSAKGGEESQRDRIPGDN